MHENRKYTRQVAKELIDVKRNNMRNGELDRDVLSLLSECFRNRRRFTDRRLNVSSPNS